MELQPQVRVETRERKLCIGAGKWVAMNGRVKCMRCDEPSATCCAQTTGEIIWLTRNGKKDVRKEKEGRRK